MIILNYEKPPTKFSKRTSGYFFQRGVAIFTKKKKKKQKQKKKQLKSEIFNKKIQTEKFY